MMRRHLGGGGGGGSPAKGPAAANARRRLGLRACRLLLSTGLVVTFATSVALLAWHERAVAVRGSTEGFVPFFDRSDATGSSAPDRGRAEGWPPSLAVYAEPISSTDVWYDDPSSGESRPKAPLPARRARGSDLTRHGYPRLDYSSAEATSNVCDRVPSLLPMDEFGSVVRDPYLPWIHDLFVSHDGTRVNVIAQNRRRCHKGKHHQEDLRFWEGQVSLLQPVAVKRANATDDDGTGSVRYRLSTHEAADADGIETRFICRFKSLDYAKQSTTYEGETLSTYPFNYEFVNWRKKKRTMMEDGKEQSSFWLSQLMFDCPIPARLQSTSLDLLLDVVPLRTPARRNERDGHFFHEGHGGPMTFDASKMWGNDHVFPKVEDSGRWENLPVCRLRKPSAAAEAAAAAMQEGSLQSGGDSGVAFAKKPHRLVACTWTSALHQRRGNERRISDGKARLREWIAFNLQVGFDHVFVFDNTGANATIFRLKDEVDPDFGDNGTSRGDPFRIRDDLSSVTDLFPKDRVTRIDWPATICNNNRPAHDDPGERSSQYAAEAACRTRYGPYTDWMASMDPDEYFVPMKNYTSWKQILDKVDKDEGRKVLKFRSTRARPLLSTLVPTYDEGAKECTHKMAKTHNQCLAKSDNRTYLETYNCEYIRSPKPDRFERAMKQFYRPDFVLSHFVHYSTVTVRAWLDTALLVSSNLD
ncbi:hypothetical protein ACHAWF_012964 [Thalassiosira exigua]